MAVVVAVVVVGDSGAFPAPRPIPPSASDRLDVFCCLGADKSWMTAMVLGWGVEISNSKVMKYLMGKRTQIIWSVCVPLALYTDDS